MTFKKQRHHHNMLELNVKGQSLHCTQRMNSWRHFSFKARVLEFSQTGSFLGFFFLALVPQGVLVKQVLCHLVVVGIHVGEVGDVVAQLLDGLHLLVQVVGLQEVTQLRTQKTNVRFVKKVGISKASV